MKNKFLSCYPVFLYPQSNAKSQKTAMQGLLSATESQERLLFVQQIVVVQLLVQLVA